MEKRNDGGERRRLTLKERQEKVYPFPDSDIPDMLEQLLETRLIQLPECKRPEELGKINDPNYCKYHRVVSHPVGKCFVLKELIMRLAGEKKIELDLDEVAQTNHAVVTMNSDIQLPPDSFEKQNEGLIQFGTFEPILVQFRCEVPKKTLQVKTEPVEDEDEGWTVVTRRKMRRQRSVQKETRLFQEYRRKSKLPKRKGRKSTMITPFWSYISLPNSS